VVAKVGIRPPLRLVNPDSGVVFMNRRGFLFGLSAGLIGSAVTARSTFSAVPGAVVAFEDIYPTGSPSSFTISPRLAELAGRRVTIHGFTAPHATVLSDFLVLSDQPLAECPHCQVNPGGAPRTVIFYLRDGLAYEPSFDPVQVTGVLDLGVKRDIESGFVSPLRLVDAEVAPITNDLRF
jgi:hypothetical protein